jgi:hypothetical protein
VSQLPTALPRLLSHGMLGEILVRELGYPSAAIVKHAPRY